MRTIETTIYKLSELSEDAQEKAHYHWLAGADHWFTSEAIDSLKAFADIFPIKVKNWSLGSQRSFIDIEFTADDDIANLSGIRLLKYLSNNYSDVITSRKWFKSFMRPASDPVLRHRKLIHKVLQTGPNKGAHWYEYRGLTREFGNCPFTGVCYDQDLLDGIQKFMARPDNTTFEELLENCVNDLCSSIQSECEYQESFAAFAENAEANDYEFTEDGSRA